MTTPSVSSGCQAAATEQPATNDVTVFVGAKALIRPNKERLVSIERQIGGRHGHWAERIAASVEEDYDQLLKDFGCR